MGTRRDLVDKTTSPSVEGKVEPHSTEATAIKAAEQRVAEAKRRAEDVGQRLMQREVGQELGLDPGLASRLVGATRAEMKADAAGLQALAKDAAPEPAPATMNDRIRAAAGRSTREPSTTVEPSTPAVPDFDGGARTSTRPSVDMNSVIREASGR